MVYTNKKGITTYYEEYGQQTNPSLLLLHGIGADHDMWHPQKKLYAKAGYHVIVPDLLAHGKSSKVTTLTLDDWSKQLLELMNFLDVEKVTLIGVSMGGVIAEHFIVNYPEKVERLIISDSFGELKTFFEKILASLQVIGFKLFKILGNRMLAKGMESTYKEKYAILAREYFSNITMKVDMSQMVLARKAINKINILEALASVKIPSLVLVGRDFGESFIKINKKIADALNVELKIIEDSKDPSNLVNPNRFNEIVLEFLKRTTVKLDE